MIGAQLRAVIGKAFKEGNLGKASWFTTTPIEHGFVSSINTIMMRLMRIIMSITATERTHHAKSVNEVSTTNIWAKKSTEVDQFSAQKR